MAAGIPFLSLTFQKNYLKSLFIKRAMPPSNNKSCSRYVVVIVFSVIAIYFAANYFISSDNNGHKVAVSSDIENEKNDMIKVKIIPASLSDDDLNSLPKDTFSYLAMIDAGIILALGERLGFNIECKL